MGLNKKQLEHLADMAKEIAIGVFVTLAGEPIGQLVAGHPLTWVLGGKLALGTVLYFVLQGVSLLIKGRLND
ncbi:hypothetical protein QU487_06995 [Crenobacter sp. SG2305]|uniref:hypothetical protein n=1 Tax=Crenobacter oryzisoli TaxID=3056844 RepID=UPI0025AA3835|nr:hypothetical protein [Crenobacter sp. SG2305]MDN0082502.1 hypothetical protein [Crenobacter sp. SG2305]